MTLLKYFACILFAVYLTMTDVLAATPSDTDPVHFKMHKLMAESTFYVHGPSVQQPLAETGGTVFILNHPFAGQDATKPGWHGDLVLITAAHVFDGVAGDSVIFDGRRLNGDGSWTKQPVTLKIRDNGKNIFSKHPSADIAVMWLVDGIKEGDEKLFWHEFQLATFNLATDQNFADCNLNIGTSLSCLGYPLGIPGNPEGFPILRNGAVASYPIMPSKTHPTFQFDFEVYAGNSGGPVYYFDPGYEADSNPLLTMKKTAAKAIVGLVSQQLSQSKIIGIDPATGGPKIENTFLKLGIVVSSPIIRETLELLRKR